MPAISSFSYLPNIEFVKVTLYNLYMNKEAISSLVAAQGVSRAKFRKKSTNTLEDKDCKENRDK